MRWEESPGYALATAVRMGVETLIELQRGGVIRGVVAGLLGGALLSVLPLELVMLLGGVPLALGAWRAVQGLRARRLSLQLIAGWSALFGVIGAAVVAPTKFVDGRVPRPLYATRLTAGEIARELELGDVEASEVVTLPSAQPTWRELRAALEAQGLELHIGYCGTGTSLLFGAGPMRLSITR